ncbi:MAG: hypothetical protein DSY53_05005 [Persephonella sp.]|nr:MAG: hypothetical protein DSY53_05005 [Persephonella sp.]
MGNTNSKKFSINFILTKNNFLFFPVKRKILNQISNEFNLAIFPIKAFKEGYHYEGKETV